MATIAEQLTTLNTNLSTISTEVGSQADLIAQIKATAESLPDAGSGSSGYQLWGSYSLMPCEIDVSDLIGAQYQCPSGISAWFYILDEGWFCKEIDRIEVNEAFLDIYSGDDDNNYFEYEVDQWSDTEGAKANDFHLLLIEVTSPVTVEQGLYNLFMRIFDNGNYSDSAGGLWSNIGYDEGYTHGAAQSGDLEALGALCDWQITTDSDSCPLLTIINHHPSYYLHCTVCDEYGADWWDYDTDDYFGWEVYVTVPPDSTKTIYADTPFSEIKPVYIDNVRWSANA